MQGLSADVPPGEGGAGAAPARGRRILVVGGEGLDLGGTFTVEQVRSVSQALTWLRWWGPDLVLLACPGAGQVATLRRVRGRSEGRDLLILALTTADPSERARMLSAGADAVLVSPAPREELVARLGELLTSTRCRELLRSRLDEPEGELPDLVSSAVRRVRELAEAVRSLEGRLAKAELGQQEGEHFTRMVTHEFRTPLHVLRLQLERLRREVADPGGGPLALAFQAWGQLSDLVESLLESSRIPSAGQSTSEPVDLAELVTGAIRRVELVAEEKGLVLGLRADRCLPLLQADARLLQGIVINLVENAVKYTTQGRISVRLRNRTGAVELRVSDTGPGIPAQYRQQVFEPFRRLPGQGEPGTGLGLFIVRQALDRLGGSVELRSMPGKGSCFRVLLPVRRDTGEDSDPEEVSGTRPRPLGCAPASGPGTAPGRRASGGRATRPGAPGRSWQPPG